MSTDTADAGTTLCKLEPRPHIWDLGGTMTATFADKTNPSEPVGFIDSNQVLLVTVTVTPLSDIFAWSAIPLRHRDLPAQDDLAGCRALGDRPQGTASVGERKRLDRRIVQPSGPAQLD